MIRTIIHIDEDKCNGCGLCARACHEGAIGMVGGKARLLREDYCDGLGDCLPACPTGAITFVQREAAAYDEAAVLRAKAAAEGHTGCPGSAARVLHPAPAAPAGPDGELPSQLRQWPVQLKLVSPLTPWLRGAHLLVAADCAAFAHGDFHRTFLRGRAVLIGCPKLDMVDYTDKLAQIFAVNDPASVTVVRMQVPCCGGIQRAVEQALERSGCKAPCRVVTLSAEGAVVSEA